MRRDRLPLTRGHDCKRRVRAGWVVAIDLTDIGAMIDDGQLPKDDVRTGRKACRDCFRIAVSERLIGMRVDVARPDRALDSLRALCALGSLRPLRAGGAWSALRALRSVELPDRRARQPVLGDRVRLDLRTVDQVRRRE